MLSHDSADAVVTGTGHRLRHLGHKPVAQCRQLGRRLAVVLHRLEAHLPEARTKHEPAQGVVILRADRVELVVMATGAGDRQPEERLAEDIDLVVDAVALVLPDVDRRMHFLAKKSPPGPKHGLVDVQLTQRFLNCSKSPVWAISKLVVAPCRSVV